jgi:hypothetical protein
VLWSLETFGPDDIEWDLACARVLARSF